MKAIILAGGKGARLKPFTDALPKAMLPIGAKPFLEIQISYLKKCDFDEVILAINYLKGNIRHYFGDGKGLGIKISYSEEKFPLGTAGAVKKAAQNLKDTFVVPVGDGLAGTGYQAPVEFHRKIIQAVRKERTRDKGWAYDQSLLGGKPELAVDIDGERIRVYLRDRKGSDALGK